MDNLAADDYFRNEGREEGRSEGEKIKAIEIAKNLLSMNLDVEVIAKATGLNEQEITGIKSQK